MSQKALRSSTKAIRATIHLPSSKSESNRALIIGAYSSGLAQIENLSDAKDTVTLERLLREKPEEMDVGHAGTAMRFLTSYLAFQPRDYVLTGSARMQERPIGPLVDALRKIGAEINYMVREGYPPLMIHGRNARFGDKEVEIPGGISSQYISSLLMLAPTLTDGLGITLTGEIRSRPYIEMTLRLMERFGVAHSWEGRRIHVPRQAYRAGTYAVEADWSSASYWYCLAALADEAEIELPGLRRDSWQGDQAIVELMAGLHVATEWTADGVKLVKRRGDLPEELRWDFSGCPDLAQGVLVAMAVLGVRGEFTGLESLRIKETDRIAALQNELGKFGVALEEEDGMKGKLWTLSGEFTARPAEIPTYHDHRMALAFAPLALHVEGLVILEPDVIVKSYPSYWADLEKAGIS